MRAIFFSGDRLKVASGYADAEATFDTVLYMTRDLAQLDHLCEDHDRQTGIPPRQSDNAGFDIKQQAAFDLTMIATAYVLLHEVRHIMFDHETERPSKPREEPLTAKRTSQGLRSLRGGE
jgi:hypothetical protein